MTLSILSSVVNDLLIPQLSPNTLYSFQETIIIKNLKSLGLQLAMEKGSRTSTEMFVHILHGSRLQILHQTCKK